MNKIFSGAFAGYCEKFILQKHAIGYCYKTEEIQLGYFDTFTKSFQFCDQIALTKELVETWVAKRVHETEKTRLHRITVIREFARFLISCGVSAYVFPSLKRAKADNFVPYIFTTEEIKKLFNAVDTLKYKTVSPYIHMVAPVIIRILYGCGLRITEVLSLRRKDIDLENGIITVLCSKFDNNRLVPMSESLKSACLRYTKEMPDSEPNAFFFPNRFGQMIGIRCIYSQFRKALWKAGISHGGRGNGPRLHDLRHTFAVHSMCQLVNNGKNLYVTSPILSTYLGHKSLAATQKYLRLTSEIHPEIIEKTEKVFGSALSGRLL